MALSPRYTSSVSPTTTAALPGQPSGGQGTNTAGDALGYVKQLVKQASQSVSYDPVYNNIYEDKTLQEFKQEAGENSQESVAYFRQHASAYVLQYVQEVKVYRHGAFYQIFRDIVENYPAVNQVHSQVKQEYTKNLLSRIDLLDIVGVRSSIWFGFIVADILRKATSGNPPRQQIIHAAKVAILNILNLEIVLWLNGSSKAQGFLYSPTPEINSLINGFAKRKEAASTVFQFFEEASPYDSANFSGERASEGNIASIMPEFGKLGIDQRLQPSEGAGFTDMHGTFVPDFSDVHSEEQRELLMIPFRNIRARQGAQDINQPAPARRVRDGYEDLDIYGSGQQYRTDLQNISLGNRHLFNIRSYFTPTVVENWYTIPEGDWVLIKGVMKRHARVRLEESIVRGCIRFVHYDFNDERNFPGWTSRSIRFNDTEKEMILSDPNKLLPLLNEENKSYEPQVLEVQDAKSFFDEQGRKLGPDAEVYEKLREPGFEFRVIKSDEKLRTDSMGKVVERFQIAGHTLSSETSKPVAIFNEFEAAGRMLFDSTTKRNLIFRRFPELFIGNEEAEDESYFSLIEKLSTSLGRSPIDDPGTLENERFDTFLARRLTVDLNEWLVNACGYAINPADGPQLSVDNILLDYKELKVALLQSDKPVYDILNQSGRSSIPKSQIAIFEKPSSPPEDLSILEKEEHELSLQRTRLYSGIVICNEAGPKPTKDRPIVLRRSNNPEFFSLIDTLKSELMKKERELEAENILVMYKNTNDLFMVTPSVYDDNVISIRTVRPVRTLLNPAYG